MDSPEVVRPTRAPVAGAVLSVRRLDEAARSGLVSSVRRLAEAGVPVVTLDLSGLERIDSHALRTVTRCARMLHEQGGRLRLAGLHPAVSRVLARAGLGRAFLWPAADQHTPALVTLPAA